MAEADELKAAPATAEARPRATRRVGYADLCAMPDDGRRYEIHGGELVVVPAPRIRHQVVAGTLFRALAAWAETHGGQAFIAPLDIVFDEHDVAQPDVVFFRAERVHLLHLDLETRVPPDIAVEVLSPSTASVDRGRKMQMYAHYRVPEYWILAPMARRIEIHALDPDTGAYGQMRVAEGYDVARSILLPDLTVDVDVIFPPLGPSVGPAPGARRRS